MFDNNKPINEIIDLTKETNNIQIDVSFLI